MATRNLNNVRSVVELVKDPHAREVLQNLVNYVEDLESFGLTTRGPIIADGGIQFLDASYPLKVKMLEGLVESGGSRTIAPISGVIWGVVGWVQEDDSDDSWITLEQGTTGTTQILVNYATGHGNEKDQVEIVNNHGTDDLQFRIMVFYTDFRTS